MLKARGKLISLLTACMALVLMLVMGITTLSIQPKVASAADTTIEFTLGANGSASHNDGSEKSSYSETVNGYTLSITGGSKMYTGARDNKGNSCIKLGTSSAVGKFSFTVPNDVASVIIAVGKYKTNTTKISVNATAYTISSSSNDGAYDTITVDTTSTKVVSLTTVSGGVRAMVNTITFVIPAAEGGCEHANTTEVTTPATCTEAGSKTVTCDDCGETVSTTTIDALGHNDTEKIITEATCTEAGEKELTCSVCGDVRTETIAAKGHTYVDGKCSECEAKEPNLETCTLTFDSEKTNRTEFSSSKQVWSQNGITFTNNKNSSSTAVADYGAPVRLYAGSNIVVEGSAMKKIEFDCNTSSYATALKNSIGNAATVSDDKVVVEFIEAVNSFTVSSLTAQVRLDSLTVTVEVAECEHTNTTTETVNATCTEAGSMSVICVDCGFIISDDNIPATGHSETEAITKPATCTENGEKTYTCGACGEARVEIILAGHNFVDDECTVCGEGRPTEATLSFETTDARVSWDANQQIWAQNGITFTNNKGSGNPIIDSSNPVRLYKNSEIIIEYAGITKIVFKGNDNEDEKYITALKESIGEGATIEGNVVTVILEEAVDSYSITLSAGQVRLDSLTVYTEKQEAGNEGVGVNIGTASVTIGADIILNYYVTMSEDFAGAKMFFTVGEKTIDVKGEKVGERYKFSLPIPPQYMVDNVKAELKLDDAVLAVKENFTVKAYATKAMAGEEDGSKLKQLIVDMLYYGAAAQNYTNHNTDNLANAGVEGASTATPTETDFNLVSNEAADSYPAYFKGAGVRFDGENSIYVNLSTTENVTLTVNGTEVAVTGTTVYTDGIKATEFGTTYTFELYCDGVLMQTLTYSVNAYAEAKKESATMGELALALYRYGQSAVAYKDAGNN